jgi:hypothetical protein
MTIEQYLSKNPSREKVLNDICAVANINCLHIEELWLYVELSEMFNISLDDFYNDQEALTEYERNYIGLYNWKVK